MTPKRQADVSRREEPMVPEWFPKMLALALEDGAVYEDEDRAVCIRAWGRVDADDVKALLAELTTLRAKHRAAVDRERHYLAAIKEYEEADINHRLAESRLEEVNDRADRLYRQWEEAPTDELQQRRRENLDDCLKQADVTAQARRRQQAARAELRNALNAAALNPDTPDMNTPTSPDPAPAGEAP